MVIFRPFGHASLNTYSKISSISVKDKEQKRQTYWVPSDHTAGSRFAGNRNNATHLGAFVTMNDLEESLNASTSEPYVVETIPRINKQQYYLDIYKQYRQDHGHLSKILEVTNPEVVF